MLTRSHPWKLVWALRGLSSLVLALVMIPPSTVSAQSVRGRLLDEETGDPIPGATATLLAGAEGDVVVRGALTDSIGEFFFRGGREGRFRLQAGRIGYQSVTSPAFDLVAPDTLVVELRMSVEAIPLAPLTVISERPPLVLSIRLAEGGFAERRDLYGREGLGSGHFLVESDWEKRGPSRISAILTEVPGVRMVGGNIRLRTVTSFDPRGCEPNFYLDGNRFRLQGQSIDDLLSAWSISAIEVYPGMSKPPQFMDLGAHPCGAIVLWTR